MKAYLLPLIITGVVSASIMAAQTGDAVNPRTSPEDIAAGAKTFRSHCSPCHGIRGGGGLGPNLASGHFFHGSTDSDLLRNISNGIDGTPMPGLFYSPDRIWQVVAYIRSLNAAASAKAEGDPVHGAELFRSKGCANCHRVNGIGGRMGPDLTQIGQSRAADFLRQSIVDPNADVQPRYWIVHFRDASGADRQGFLMNEDTYTVQFIDTKERLQSLSKADLKDYRIEKVSKMPSYRDKLSEGELQDLVAYLSSLRVSGASQ